MIVVLEPAPAATDGMTATEYFVHKAITDGGIHGCEWRALMDTGKAYGHAPKDITAALTKFKENGSVKFHRQRPSIDCPLYYYSTATGYLLGSKIIGKA